MQNTHHAGLPNSQQARGAHRRVVPATLHLSVAPWLSCTPLLISYNQSRFSIPMDDGLSSFTKQPILATYNKINFKAFPAFSSVSLQRVLNSWLFLSAPPPFIQTLLPGPLHRSHQYNKFNRPPSSMPQQIHSANSISPRILATINFRCIRRLAELSWVCRVNHSLANRVVGGRKKDKRNAMVSLHPMLLVGIYALCSFPLIERRHNNNYIGHIPTFVNVISITLC